MFILISRKSESQSFPNNLKCNLRNKFMCTFEKYDGKLLYESKVILSKYHYFYFCFYFTYICWIYIEMPIISTAIHTCPINSLQHKMKCNLRSKQMTFFLVCFLHFPKPKTWLKVNIVVRKDVGYKYSLARDILSCTSFFNKRTFRPYQMYNTTLRNIYEKRKETSGRN